MEEMNTRIICGLLMVLELGTQLKISKLMREQITNLALF